RWSSLHFCSCPLLLCVSTVISASKQRASGTAEDEEDIARSCEIPGEPRLGGRAEATAPTDWRDCAAQANRISSTCDGRSGAVAAALTLFTPAECRNYIRHSGYSNRIPACSVT